MTKHQKHKNATTMSPVASPRVLVVEDDLSILDAISLVLQAQGYDVRTATDHRALELIENDPPDIIFLDIWMTGMDGREICEKLKKNETTAPIPIIMLSAHKDTAKIAQECGANGYLLKPFEMVQLVEVIEQHLAKSAE